MNPPLQSGICNLGSINMDIVVQVERFPEVGETVSAGKSAFIPGGKGANQAVAAARMGAHVDFIGAVGTDKFGTNLRNYLAQERVAIDHVAQVQSPTGIAVVTVDQQGGNRIIVIPGSNAVVHAEQVKAYFSPTTNRTAYPSNAPNLPI